MLLLPNGCKCSKPTLSKYARGWRIIYRFYDPLYPKPKFVEHKAGLNDLEPKQRKAVADVVIAELLNKLQVRGYNPFTKTFQQEDIFYEIDPETPIASALEQARLRLDIDIHTKRDMKSVVKGIGLAAAQLRIENLPISKVSRKHLKLCIEQYSRIAKRFSETRYNTYRSYLIMMFTELVELEATIANPARELKKKPVTQNLRVVATDEQRKQIKEHLKQRDERFYKFVHLFFHSGGRKTELMQLKPYMVDLDRQVYRCAIKKGKNRRVVERTIKDVAVEYWQYFLNGCAGDQFIFGTLLKPGAKPMGVDYPTRCWQRYVKKGLGINVDFYSLKHLNTTEIVDILDEEAAAEMNKHLGTALVKSIYDVKNSQRQHERLKKVGNEL